MSADWFPPKGKTCLLKWSQVSLYLWENTSSGCHRNLNAPIPANFDFHNTPIVMEHRAKMLNDQWPADGRGCEHCRDQEKYSGMSDRVQFLKSEGNKRYVPKELYTDPTAIHVKPTMLSIHFNNKCNLKCIYCGPNQSSSWVKEEWKYEQGKDYDIDPWELDATYKERLGKFYEWMEENYQGLRAFDILGGEPFLQKETFDCIDWCEAHPNPEVDFEIYSNMQVKPVLFRRGIEKVRALARTCNSVELTTSIDAWGREGEFIRDGHDLATFKENFEYVLAECPEIIPGMNWSITGLSMPHIYELQEQVIEWQNKYNRMINVNFNKVIDPYIYDPSIFPKGTFTKDIERILELNEVMYGDREYKHYAKSIFTEIENSPARPDAVKELYARLDVLDKRRNTHWREVLPWLAKLETTL